MVIEYIEGLEASLEAVLPVWRSELARGAREGRLPGQLGPKLGSIYQTLERFQKELAVQARSVRELE